MNLSGLKDEELLSDFFERRDKRLLGELFIRHKLMVFSVAMKYLKHQEQAEDAVMNLFERLFDIQPKAPVLQVKPWLYTLIKNSCLMELRSKSNGNISLEDELFFESVMENESILHLPDEGNKKEEILQAMERELENLNAFQKVCVCQFYLEGKSYEEISRLNRISLNEVKSHIQNGKRNLRIRLQESGNGWMIAFLIWISSHA